MLVGEFDVLAWKASLGAGALVFRWSLLVVGCAMILLVLDRWRQGRCGAGAGVLALTTVVGGVGSLVYLRVVGEPWWTSGLSWLGCWEDAAGCGRVLWHRMLSVEGLVDFLRLVVVGVSLAACVVAARARADCLLGVLPAGRMRLVLTLFGVFWSWNLLSFGLADWRWGLTYVLAMVCVGLPAGWFEWRRQRRRVLVLNGEGEGW